MNNIAIKVDQISKAYQLGQIGTGTISRDLHRWYSQLRGQEDPFLKIGETNDRSVKGTSNIVWSLKDLNFEIKEGEAVGIIGRNGAGKSTLLKILSRVTSPTSGRISGKGRIASLLEVGTGFHPELTGKENIYLNGAILGMRKHEIKRKFDDIVEFSGVERYIDTPVKRYSSGMYVRLAFAVAAHLESEILIVDEVLAVGDAEFQSKCLGKMKDVSVKDGRTVLFVSHNMAAIRKLCTSAMLLKNGALELEGTPAEVIDHYLSEGSEVDRILEWPAATRPKSEELEVHSLKVFDSKGRLDTLLTTGDNLSIEINYFLKDEIKDLRVAISLLTPDGTEVFSSSDFDFQPSSRTRKKGNYTSVCHIPGKFLNVGNYIAIIDFDVPGVKGIIMGLTVTFTVSELSFNQLGITMSNKPSGIVHPYLEWEIHNHTRVGKALVD